MRFKRRTYFVCSAIYNGKLVNQIIDSNSEDDAKKIFLTDFQPEVYEILGPFYKKKISTKVDVEDKKIKFSNMTKKAIYNNWHVNAFLLKEPENCAYLVFIKHVSDKKITCPSKSIVVPISELRMS